MATPLDRLRTALTGRYEVEHELGRRGMTVVCLARDLKAIASAAAAAELRIGVLGRTGAPATP